MSRTILALVLTAACSTAAESPPSAGADLQAQLASAAPAAAPAPAAPKSEAERTVADVAVASPDHTTLVAALQAAGLVPALASPGGVYTVFAPTNAAFDALPPGTVDGLLKPEAKADLERILQHHAAVPILQQAAMTEGRTLGMSDGRSVTFHVRDGSVFVDDARIVGAVPAVNGIVYVVDKVILPKT